MGTIAAMRNFRSELCEDRCWDRLTQVRFDERGEALEDCILQNREELIALCGFIEAQRIRSYLEIGTWTGRLVSTLHRLFRFDRVAACDDGYARRFGLPIALPDDAEFFEGDSSSEHFVRWREGLGHFDLVLIDANHHYRGVRRDFEINRGFPHRFLAFHDITGHIPQTRGVKQFWDELTEGRKTEIVRPHRELGLDHSTMGIGIWSAAERISSGTPAPRP